MEQTSMFDFGIEYRYQPPLHFDRPVRLFEAFAGIGCQRMAFNRTGIPYVSVGVSEIDKYALKSYEAIHGDCNNYGDITKMTEIPPCDIFTWSFPCTDLSKAGKQIGLKGGTRSGLVYEVLRLLRATEEKPVCLIMENVPDLVQVKFAAEFYEIQKEIERMGYRNYTSILNAKDYGVAQNRERVFMVSILGPERYEFPPPFPLELRLKDYLEETVDEKYYLSEKAIKGFEANHIRQEENEPQIIVQGNYSPSGHEACRIIGKDGLAATVKHNHGSVMAIQEPQLRQVLQLDTAIESTGRVYSEEGLCPTISTCGGGQREPKIIDTYNHNGIKDSVVIGSMQKNAYRGTTDDPCPTLNAAMGMGGGQTPLLANGSRIRKLTPLECWRLMGIDDEDFRKAQAVVSNSQLYKMAGNGIVVDVFARILDGLIQK